MMNKKMEKSNVYLVNAGILDPKTLDPACEIIIADDEEDVAIIFQRARPHLYIKEYPPVKLEIELVKQDVEYERGIVGDGHPFNMEAVDLITPERLIEIKEIAEAGDYCRH